MKGYETEQRKRLFSFFMDHPDTHFTIEELSKNIEGISLSAIYRNVSKMIDDGKVRRFQKDGCRKFLYQYIAGGECASHLHLKCNGCGLILHMEQGAAQAIIAAARKSNRFEIDKTATILYGRCTSCKQGS
ncbi:MAG: Fur family transcriptional regulator [Christensenellales bacterium]|jgi:Fur family ferric uptake transcriptional regulator